MAFDFYAVDHHRRRMVELISQFGGARDKLREVYVDAAARRPLTGRSDTEAQVFNCLAELIDALTVTKGRFEGLVNDVGDCGKIVEEVDNDIARAAARCRLKF